jgi:hypothetical protein
VQRSAPCGSTHLVAEKLTGVHIKEAVPQAGLHAHHYPCLASMHLEPTGDTLMHISGYVVNCSQRKWDSLGRLSNGHFRGLCPAPR